MRKKGSSEGVFKRFLRALKELFGGGAFLCDTCRYDWGEACAHPEKPNARRCPDYTGR